MNFCDNIEDIQNLSVDCSLVKGARNYGYYIPLEWIDKKASKVSGNVVTELVLKDDKKFACIMQRLRGFEDTATALNAGTYSNAFDNTIAFKVFGNDAQLAEQIDKLKDTECVFVIYQKHESEFDSASTETKISSLRVYGWDCGAKMSACDNNLYDDDLKNGWSLQFTEEEAAHSAMYLAFDQYTDTLFPYKAVIGD